MYVRRVNQAYVFAQRSKNLKCRPPVRQRGWNSQRPQRLRRRREDDGVLHAHLRGGTHNRVRDQVLGSLWQLAFCDALQHLCLPIDGRGRGRGLVKHLLDRPRSKVPHHDSRLLHHRGKTRRLRRHRETFHLRRRRRETHRLRRLHLRLRLHETRLGRGVEGLAIVPRRHQPRATVEQLQPRLKAIERDVSRFEAAPAVAVTLGRQRGCRIVRLRHDLRRRLLRRLAHRLGRRCLAYRLRIRRGAQGLDR